MFPCPEAVHTEGAGIRDSPKAGIVFPWPQAVHPEGPGTSDSPKAGIVFPSPEAVHPEGPVISISPKAGVVFPCPETVHPERPGQAHQVTAAQHQVREMVYRHKEIYFLFNVKQICVYTMSGMHFEREN